MKFVLRDKQTGRYLQRPGLWVRRMRDAMTFEDMVEVREYCQAHRIEGVQPVRRLVPYLLQLLRNRRGAGPVSASATGLNS